MRLLVALTLLALVCTRSKLLVLLRRFVNSVKLRRFTLDVDWRFSGTLRCTDAAVVTSLSSSGVFPEGRGNVAKMSGDMVMPARCG